MEEVYEEMTCKNECVKYKAAKPLGMGRYEAGQRRCQICEIYMWWDGNFCPCCGYRVRGKPRARKYKKILRDKNK